MFRNRILALLAVALLVFLAVEPVLAKSNSLPPKRTAWMISGTIGIAGGNLNYDDGGPKTATAGTDGNYNFLVSDGWTGTVTPFLTGYTFTPASSIYNTPVTSDLNGQNFVAEAVPEIQVLDGVTDIPSGMGTVNFGITTVGIPITKTFSVKNNGMDSLTLTEPITTPVGFTMTSSFGSTTVLPGGSTTFQIRLNTASVGNSSGTLSFINNDSDENPFNFSVSGTVHGIYFYYVKPVAYGTRDCRDWANACTLQTALTRAVRGEEIWVAAGTHRPTTGTNRYATFRLKEGVAIYGGFAGMETAREQRDPMANLTILTGDLNGDDDGFANNAENVYHVVTGATGATLDGFTIMAGNANGGGDSKQGGGIYNNGSNPVLTNVILKGNSALDFGGGMYNYSSDPELTNVTFSNNSVLYYGGGMYNNSSNPTLTDVTFNKNLALEFGGGMYSYSSNPILTNVTFNNNPALVYGGGMYNNHSSPTLTNVTFSRNSAYNGGGGMYNTGASSPALTNITFSGNSADYGGGIYNNSGSNPMIRNTVFWSNTAPNGAQIYNSSSASGVSDSVVQGGCPAGSTCTNILTTDPLLDTLGDYGGFTRTIPLLAGSSAIDTGNDATCAATDQRGVTRPQDGNFDGIAACDIGAYESNKNVAVTIGDVPQGYYDLDSGQSARVSYVGVNYGPLRIASSTPPIIASERVIYGGKSYSEMMGLPASQLTTEYVFPWYNNTAMDSQLRVSNLGGADTQINVYLGGSTTPFDTFTLLAGQAVRKTYAGQNNGPMRVTSSASNILTTIRTLYASNSYSELMGFPANQLTTEYVFPWYNNTAMSSQLRVGNVGGSDTQINVYLGSSTTPLDTFALLAGQSLRKTYAGQNNGPMRVTSSVANILTTIRVLYNTNSYSELMGFPANQLAKEYWYPVYDNATLDTQLRVSNVGGADTQINIYLGSSTTPIDTYTLLAGQSLRKTYAGLNNGPLHVTSSASNILTTTRLLYTNASFASYYELTGLPDNQLSTDYRFPWYNNVAMSSEVRFAVP